VETRFPVVVRRVAPESKEKTSPGIGKADIERPRWAGYDGKRKEVVMPRTARKKKTYEVSPDMPNAENAKKILFMEAGWQGDQGVYGLSSWTKDRIREVYPDALIIPVILMGMDKAGDYERYHRPYWEQIARMLTGLTSEQIGRLGGIRLVYLPAKKVLWEWHPEAAIPQSEASQANDCGSAGNPSGNTSPRKVENEK
jgi:hypothetical protein